MTLEDLRDEIDSLLARFPSKGTAPVTVEGFDIDSVDLSGGEVMLRSEGVACQQETLTELESLRDELSDVERSLEAAEQELDDLREEFNEVREELKELQEVQA